MDVPGAIERWLEAERDQLPLWMPVALGLGIAAWFVLPDARAWTAFLLAAAGLAMLGLVLPLGGRLGRVVVAAGVLAALGCALVWWRAERVAAPVLARPGVFAFTARVLRVEPLPARDLVRLRLAPVAMPTLPPVVRVNLEAAVLPPGVAPGAVLRLRARLVPPPDPAVPGAYDFTRVAWFDGIGATGRAFTPVSVVTPAAPAGGGLRNRLTEHIQRQVAGSAGGVAAAFVTGDRGAIGEVEDEAMRRAGLAHLLSISGLHVTAVVGATMLLLLRLLALVPALALRVRLPLVAASGAALAAIGYTWLSGAEVPTIRSCVAALLVLAALAMGREAITLRLVATGAFVVLLVLPESLAGPSFQLSFAAVTAIVALHEHPRVSRWFQARDEGVARRLLRNLGSLLLTGVAVEAVLMPIGLFHFHKAGLYGALANLVAIPLTTFVVMPAEAVALLLDAIGLGAPAWWVVERALALLLWIARTTAAVPGSVAALPSMPDGAFALMVAGGLWLALWRTRARLIGLAPLAAGALWALITPAPDLLVTGDGRHLAVRTADGGMAILRDRAGEYVRGTLGEGGGVEGELPPLADQPNARCTTDVCVVDVAGATRTWRILATRSGYLVQAGELIALCRDADVVVSERRLPRGCTPRWLRLDRPMLAQTGGLAVRFDPPEARRVRGSGDRHPWITPPVTQPVARRWPEQRGRGKRERRWGGSSDGF
ncbi:ComEC/Rec2 family competence protein [Sphingomonas sp. PL-96]|uniref:ComEC/Rec2 family competence protein n=1 Tax=Sphingomonas sp. PL-96 TaxID=2887201 RepID=UPI001E500BA2|nr:ComEC/Rec2 family competence protein [Sphingomonas sp. PL-96]MCC2976455.1 ComEC/Rec2 family competence protein [Sphingomonas sp. PL-96]